MAYIVDAYNVLHCSHVLPDHLAAINAGQLCELMDCAGFSPAKVVCDGSPKPMELPVRETGQVELIHAGPGRDADSLIEKLIEVDTAPRQLRVVSNDRRIQAAARKRRAAIVSSEQFLRQLAAAVAGSIATDRSKPDVEPTDSQTDYWMKQFGFDNEDDG